MASKYINLSLRRLELDFCIFGGQQLVTMITLGLEELGICDIVLFLLLLIPINPHLSGLLLAIDDFIQITDLFIQLFPCYLKLPFKSLPLGVEALICSDLLNMALIQLIHVGSLSGHLFILEFQRLLETLGSLHFLTEFDFGLVPHLVRCVQFAHSIRQVLLGGAQLILHLRQFNLCAA